MLFTLGLFVAITTALVPLIQRDLRCAVQRRRWRRSLRRIGSAARHMSVAMSGLGVAAVRAAAEMERTMARVRAESSVPRGEVLERLQALARGGQ